jgi:hypothetical protein
MLKLKTKWFHKWAKKHKIVDKMLLEAIDNVENNLSSTNLGGGLFKVRIASSHRGKSSSFRTIIVYKKDDKAVIVYGFKKNEQENLSKSELKAFKILAKDILSLNSDDINKAIIQRIFIKIGESS